LLRNDKVDTAIIFANRKTTVRELNQYLQRDGFSSSEIHGDMDQGSRLKELDRFKSGEVNILVASDVAARGLDIKGVSHIFNFDTPWHPDDYVHRIGRTGRAGAKGRAFTFVAEEDAEAIANVEKLTGAKIKVFGKEDVRVELADPGKKSAKPKPEEAEADHDAPRQEPREEPREEKSRDEKPSGGDRPRRTRSRGRKRDDTGADADSGIQAPREPKPRREREPRSEDNRSNDAPERNPRSGGSSGTSSGGSSGRSGRRDRDDEPVAAGEWNGPKPGFLDLGAG
jgi:superfamily II DNA/RNA helicase